MRLAARNLPTRVSTGAYILHAGWDKWHGDEAQAAGVHGIAAAAFPFLGKIPPRSFLNALATVEVGLGVALLAPFVPHRVAGLGLTGFAGGLLTMYLRTPGLHEPGSIWPTPAGTGVGKDAWMLGIGLDLLTERGSRAE